MYKESIVRSLECNQTHIQTGAGGIVVIYQTFPLQYFKALKRQSPAVENLPASDHGTITKKFSPAINCRRTVI